jgi:hypothetical protein
MMRDLKPGDRIKVFGLRSKRLVGTVIHHYPLPSEHHLVRIQRDNIASRETFHRCWLKKITNGNDAAEQRKAETM